MKNATTTQATETFKCHYCAACISGKTCTMLASRPKFTPISAEQDRRQYEVVKKLFPGA